MQRIDLAQGVIFNPVGHKYTDKNGKELISVSTLYGLYKEKFDEDGSILTRCAAKRGISEEELKKEWEKAGTDATTRGNLFHGSVEHFINTKKILKNEFAKTVKAFSKIKFQGKLQSETIIGEPKLGIAGTADVIEFLPDNSVSVYDFKSNKAIKKFSFGKRMKFPISHLWDANFYHYSLQMSIYCYLLDLQGYWVNQLKIFHITPIENKIVEHPIEYLKKEAADIIAHYNDPNSFKVKDPIDDWF